MDIPDVRKLRVGIDLNSLPLPNCSVGNLSPQVSQLLLGSCQLPGLLCEAFFHLPEQQPLSAGIIVDYIDNSWSWKASVITQFGPAILSLALFIPLVPESPYYLINKGRLDDARNALNKIRGKGSFDVDAEIREIQATLEQERQQSSHVVMQIFIGYPLCGNYLAYFLTLSGVDDAFVITIISVLCSMFAAIFAFFLIGRVGRRPQLMFGTYGMLVCLLVVSLLGFFGRGENWNSQALAAFCIIWSIFYYMSVGAVGWTIVGEISSSRLRAKTTSLAAISGSICNMGWSIAIPCLVNTEEANLGPKAGLVFLGSGTVLAVVAFFSVPETKGRTFHELDSLFLARVPARKFESASHQA
ncbi:Major facilitator superfamily domain, general substrate transporter [Colletotrichum scovillei]|uniref:Major facilitator superfamily domain, general substrate transporter n=1 Tax=Colletotrichum scovillei TaxID=1209932 RepID=UPI0015C2FBF4|nr:Major facilitator superfamily domain, general substrate transporter [Colletotrichum scovillei]KAF4783358.1 Major facilitator superfamily domain, general substrate transporter [Colletotrichum scovillei]